MHRSLLSHLWLVIFLGACASSSRNSNQTISPEVIETPGYSQPEIANDLKPASLMDLPQSLDGGFVLAPGFYEAEFKTYCLQPGTPDPSPGDAYLQEPVSGYRKEIIETVLLNSNQRTDIEQKNIQLLLWSIVSGSDFNKLSPAVQSVASELLTPKQVFELKGGVLGLIKTVSQTTGILNANSGMKRLFETGTSTYESYERLAVLKEPSQIKRTGVKPDQWYKQEENYYVRYIPVSYKMIRIQVYVPGDLAETVVYDPVAQQAVPAFTNAQRLGIGAPIVRVLRKVIHVNKKSPPIKKLPPKKEKTLAYSFSPQNLQNFAFSS
jgi:hypothetical protein